MVYDTIISRFYEEDYYVSFEPLLR